MRSPTLSRHRFRRRVPVGVIALLACALGIGLGALGGAGSARVVAGLVFGALGVAVCGIAVGVYRTRARERVWRAEAARSVSPKSSLEGAAALAEVNERSGRGESTFRTLAADGGQLVLMGGFDLDHAHDVEVTFHDVAASGCPDWLQWPQMHDAGAVGARRRFVIEDDNGRYEVVARAVSVEVGRVYHGDLGRPLAPGERSWARPEGSA